MPSMMLGTYGMYYAIWEYQRKRLKRLNINAEKVFSAISEVSRR